MSKLLTNGHGNGTFNPSTQETDADLCEFKANLLYIMNSWPITAPYLINEWMDGLTATPMHCWAKCNSGKCEGLH